MTTKGKTWTHGSNSCLSFGINAGVVQSSWTCYKLTETSREDFLQWYL